MQEVWRHIFFLAAGRFRLLRARARQHFSDWKSVGIQVETRNTMKKKGGGMHHWYLNAFIIELLHMKSVALTH